MRTLMQIHADGYRAMMQLLAKPDLQKMPDDNCLPLHLGLLSDWITTSRSRIRQDDQKLLKLIPGGLLDRTILKNAAQINAPVFPRELIPAFNFCDVHKQPNEKS
jgi:hypothetical protein